MKKILSVVMIFISMVSYAQFEPRIILKDKKELKLSFLDVQIKITGNYALSTYTMKFHNGYNRVLEGELNFPLLQGQNIVDFQMEVNGSLREAVVVEKEKARVAYETTVRRKIDPGLLEKTQGNNYKVRVYPINPNSDKLIKIVIEEPLRLVKGKNELSLRFDSKTVVDNFSLGIDVVGGELSLDEDAKNLGLKTFRLKNHQIARLIKKKQALSSVKGKFYCKIADYPIVNTSDVYFNSTVKIENSKTIVKKHRKISLLWDTSLSMLERDLDKELKFLDSYFKLFPNLEVQLITFSNQIQTEKKLKVSHGNWFALREELASLQYDGATDYEKISKLKLHQEVFVFTDGLGNFDGFKALKGNITLVNASQKANHNTVHFLGGDRNDVYVNLMNTSVLMAIEQVKSIPVQFMGYKKNIDVYEAYHDVNIQQGSLFSISGKFKKNTQLELQFGDGKKVSITKKIVIENDQKNELSTRLWAKNKMKSLERKRKENKEKIINHAKEFKLVTDYTSLIVLDRLEDYLRYKIEPPVALQREYKRRLVDREKQEKKEEIQLARKKEDVVREAKAIYNWYEKDFKFKKVDKVDEIIAVEDNIDIPETRSEVDDIVYSDEEEAMEEVIIVGYGRQRKREVTGAMVTTTEAEVEDMVMNDISVALQGRVTGVNIGSSTKKKSKKLKAIHLKAWNSKTPYLEKLRKTKTIEEAYKLYLKLRPTYMQTPTFFIDVADYFIQKKSKEQGVLILSSLLDLDLNNYELLKAMSYKLDELKEYELAVKVNQKIVELRSEDPQSYRDLALAYQAVGEFKKAFDLLYSVYTGEFLKHDVDRHRFDGIEQIAYVELTQLVSLHRKELKLAKQQELAFKKMPVDVRVVVDWNHNDTDLDLWVIDPNGEKCYYNHKLTKLGGRISNDMTEGFGPEEFLLKKAVKGNYTIKVKYYSDTKQKISGPTVLKLTTFINYGLPTKIKEVKTYRLTGKKEVLEIGTVPF